VCTWQRRPISAILTKEMATRISHLFSPQRGRPLAVLLLASFSLNSVLVEPAAAEMRTVTADGEYRMGPRDTREDAVRLATETAKRHALEQVATYLESVTVVTNLDVTSDEIRTYTAGLILVLDQQISTRLDEDTVVIRVDLTAQVDPDDVVQAIAALRQNEDARRELAALKAEVDQLRQQLEAANQALTTATTPDQVQTVSQQRQQLLNQLQANALVSQAWTDWVLVTPVVYPSPWIGLGQVQGLLAQAGRVNPTNPHIVIIQRVITPQVGPLPTGVPPRTPPQAQPPAQPPPPSSASSPPPTLQQIQPASPPPPAPTSPPSKPPQLAQPPPPRSLPPTLNQVHPLQPHHVSRAPFVLSRQAPGTNPKRSSEGGQHRR
jgi:predicted component of type VI protein secretion system